VAISSNAGPQRNRALIYIRKSIVRTGSDAISPERQRANCLQEAERHGWLVEEGDVYVDAEGHQSGRDDGRIAWQRLRRRLRSDSTVVAVIVESLSRASRSVRSFFEFVEELRARGIGLVSLKERFDTSNAIGQAMLGFIAVVNQLESDLASERMTAQIAYKKSRGRHWGLTPFGCAREPVTGALSPSEETYTVGGEDRRYHDSLVALYDLYRDGDHSLVATGRELNAQGWRFRGRQGSPRRWDENNVRSVLLMHRVYAGWVPLEGHNKDKGTRWVDGEWVRGNFDPVLPPELCDAVRDALAARSRVWRLPEPKTRDRSEPSPYTLTGILTCAECGRRLNGHTMRGVRYYRHARLGDCSQTWCMAEILERETEEILLQLHLPQDAAHIAVAEMLASISASSRDEADAEIEEIDANLRRVAGEQDRLVQLAISTSLNGEIYQRNLRRLEEERGILLTHRHNIEAFQAAEAADLEAVLTQISEVVALLSHEVMPTARRDLIHGILRRVEYRDGHIVAWGPREWCKPFF